MAKQAIENTARTGVNPQWTMGGAPGEIEAQESRGQDQMVSSDKLPTTCRAEDKAILEAAGVEFGPPDKGDPLFCTAKLPGGWKKRSTDHPMWSELVDGDGVVQASIFYKAAFYDRRASIRLKG